jgi:hypothetical protein
VSTELVLRDRKAVSALSRTAVWLQRELDVGLPTSNSKSDPAPRATPLPTSEQSSATAIILHSATKCNADGSGYEAGTKCSSAQTCLRRHVGHCTGWLDHRRRCAPWPQRHGGQYGGVGVQLRKQRDVLQLRSTGGWYWHAVMGGNFATTSLASIATSGPSSAPEDLINPTIGVRCARVP